MPSEMTVKPVNGIPFGRAICYSGYRDGQDPRAGVFPSYKQIHQDLRMLVGNWQYLRVYDSGIHADTLLSVIIDHNLPFQVMLGVDIAAEVSNPQCPWGAQYSDKQLEQNRLHNQAEIERTIKLAQQYPEQVCAVSIGNEASVEWTDHLVPVERLVSYAKKIKQSISHPVTFCENYVPWTTKLAPLVDELDFISIHTYPVWEYQSLSNAMAYTEANYRAVAEHYPNKPVVITEAGWTTCSNGRGIETWNASAEFQEQYCKALIEWSEQHKILTFVFEAFDETWKGSDDPHEPEKHWGLYRVDRTPKMVVSSL